MSVSLKVTPQHFGFCLETETDINFHQHKNHISSEKKINVGYSMKLIYATLLSLRLVTTSLSPRHTHTLLGNLRYSLLLE